VEAYRYTAIDPAKVDEQEIDEARPLAWLSYLSILFLIPLFALRGNRYALFHVRQGMILFAYKIGLIIASLILSFLVVGLVLWIVGSIILFVLCIVGIVKSALGEFWKAPLWIYELAQKLPIS
jgi:uncharacterized membrane protein